MKRMLRRSLAAAVLGLTASLAQAVPITYTTQLSGASEEPPVNSPGTGSATVVFDADAHTLAVDTTFSSLVAPTTAAHIHCCTATSLAGNAGVATQVPTFVDFPLGVTSGTYSNSFDLTDLGSWNPDFVDANGGTAAGAEAALGAGLAAGLAYLNIHSEFAPTGEIRGFLVAAASVPEPATLALIGMALVALAASHRRRRE